MQKFNTKLGVVTVVELGTWSFEENCRVKQISFETSESQGWQVSKLVPESTLVDQSFADSFASNAAEFL
jgi:hypothetical protein